MKRLLWLFALILLIQNQVYSQTVYDDNYEENPNYIQGNKYLENSQYSSAISEFKKALRVNPLDNSSIIGLSNSYNLRAEYYNNTMKSTENAITDLKSALFFTKYFASDDKSFSMSKSIAAMEKNLDLLESSLKKEIKPENRFDTARAYRTKGEFAAAGYDYFQILDNTLYEVQANCALGDIFKIFNRPDRAVGYYKEALKIIPDSTDTHLKLARTYEQLNDYTSALSEYNYALNTSSEREDILNSLEKIWQKKADISPRDAEVHANLGVVYQKQKRYQEALVEYKKAEALNPSNINTKINIGTLYQEQKKYDEALNMYNAILQVEPKNTTVMTYQAQCYKALKRNDDAISIYKSVLNLDPKNTVAKSDLFELLKETMPTENVLDFLYKNVQNSPTNADSYYEFAYELHKANKIDDAIVYYNQTIKLNKNKIDAYVNLSQAYRQKKDYEASYETIKNGLALAPENDTVKKQYNTVLKEFETHTYNNASAAFQQGEYLNAIKEYSKITPPTSDSLTAIGASYQAINKTKEAIEYYQKAINIDPKNAELPYYIASIYMNENDLTNAKTYAQMTISKNPFHKKAKEILEYIDAKDVEVQLTNAISLYDSKKYSDAIQLLDEIIKNNEHNSTAYYYRALSYDGIENYKNAIEDYKQTIKYAPEMAIVYYSLAVDYDSVSDFDNAKTNYQKYIELANDTNDYTKYAQSRIDEIK